jgi:hypothetical protein
MEDRRRAEMMYRAEAWRLLRQVGEPRSQWLTRQGCWLLCQLGRFLVELGRQLERYGLLQAEPGTGGAR